MLSMNDKASEIKNLKERIDIFEQKELIYKNKIKYKEEKAKHASSITCKKGRVKHLTKEQISFKGRFEML